MARPTKWSEELEVKALDYINNYKDLTDHSVPSVVGLCAYINIAKSTVYDWSEKNIGQFSDIVCNLLEKQELGLINGGLSGDYNSSISKLMLTKHGYHDKLDQDNTSSDNSMTPVTLDTSKLSDEALKELMNIRNKSEE